MLWGFFMLTSVFLTYSLAKRNSTKNSTKVADRQVLYLRKEKTVSIIHDYILEGNILPVLLMLSVRIHPIDDRPLCEQNWQRWPTHTDYSFTVFGELLFTTFYKMFGFGPWCWKSIQYRRYFPCHKVGTMKPPHPNILASVRDAADAHASL